MAVLCTFLAAACVFDYGGNKIPNPLILLTVAAGTGKGYLETGPGGALYFLASAGGVILLLYPIFRIGMLGAGDVKLLGVSAGFFPIDKIFYFLFISMLVAAIFSIVQIIRERNAAERLQYFCEYCGDVIRTGNWKLYFANRGGAFTGICMAGPVLISALLHWGGVY